MSICPNCGSENPDYAYFCGKCAAELKDRSGKPYVTPMSAEPPAAPVKEAPHPEAKKRKETVNPVIGGACIMVAGFLAVLQGAILLVGESVTDYLVGEITLFAGLWGLGFIVTGLGALLLGLRALRRVGYEGALIGAVLGIVGMGFGIGPFLALGGLVLIALSREEFAF